VTISLFVCFNSSHGNGDLKIYIIAFFFRREVRLKTYLVIGGVAVGRGFVPQSDLELFFAEILSCNKPGPNEVQVFHV
jgi:hypothetical protein